jgi:AbrB family looped-hinge helix DNA binding protein
MPKSTITSKNQTTVPKEVREQLGLGSGDVIDWEIVDGHVRVSPATRAFLARRGSVRTGRGSTVKDVRAARRQRGL